jgi:peptidyl-prolyl cis-trans isomerase C
MSLDQSVPKKTAAGKGLMAMIIAGIITLAAGSFFMTRSSEAEPAQKAKTEESAKPADSGDKVENAAPADASGQPAAAESGSIKLGDPVVAQIGEDKILRSDVFNYISTLPEQIRQMPLQNLFPLALDQVINNKIIGMKAEQAKLESDPEVAKLVEQAKGQIMRNVYIERELSKTVSEKELRKAYDKMLAGFEKVDEIHARHILVADEAKAREIIKKLDEGVEFKDLAKESSDGPTAANGGDLGYFTKTEMVPEFADAAFALQPGTYTKNPVKTQFGWHVIKVEDKRPRPAPKFEDVKPQLDAQIRREELNKMLEKWQKDAGIKKFDINGDPVKAEPKKE